MREGKLIESNPSEDVRSKAEYEISEEVVKHLLARQNLRPPFSDGRKIIGYFFGGFLTGIRGVGAAAALQKLRLNYAFDELYGSSAGFASASYFLTPNGPRLALEAMTNEDMWKGEELNLRNPFKVTKPDYYLNIIDKVKCLKVESVLQHPTRLFGRVRNTKNGECKFIEAGNASQEHFVDVLQATMKLPYLSPGSVTIDGEKYKDPASKADQIASVDEFLAGDATDIVLVISNEKQFKNLKKHRPEIFSNSRILILTPDLNSKLGHFPLRRQNLLPEGLKMQTQTEQLFKNLQQS